MRVLCKAFALVLTMMVIRNGELKAQDSSSLYNKILHFPDRLFNKVNKKTEDISSKLISQSDKYLQHLAKEEDNLKKQVAKKDSLAASRIFDDAQQQYAALQARINNVSGKAASLKNKYIPHLDTLKTAFNFLSKADGIMKNLPETQGKITAALGKMDGLQDKFNQAEEIKKFIQQRKQVLQEQMGRFGLSQNLKAYQKQVYYYQAQVDNYKKMFSDPSKMETKALELLNRTRVFKDFFAKNSQLAGMFRMPTGASPDAVANLAGMQTRASVEKDMLQRFGSIPNAQAVMQQQVQSAKQKLNALKDKIRNLGGGSTEQAMPDFKPNNQKTKTFKQRLEFGSNMQTVKSTYFFPSTTDIALSVGYKINDKSVIGIGGSYKMGWGRDIGHVSITHQGMGLRSFIDYKLKGSIWLSGGAEMNYLSQFSNFEILDNYSAWKKSALLGLTKKYQVSKKVQGNAQLMYDGLWKQQVPRTQPIVFRVGYTLH